MLGQALAKQKQYPQALTAFLKAGDEAQAYNNIGVYYFMDGKYEEAAKCFQRAIEIRPIFYQEAKTNLQKALEKLQESRHGGS
jgi:tetratricopeptide (TPR) repeat protein